MEKRFSRSLAMAALLAGFLGDAALAQQLIVYPSQGQSQDQQDKDRYECHTWAVQQSGFDPTTAAAAAPQPAAPPPPSAQAPEGGLVRGAARGAAVGAVGGAIFGDAGKGAAAGAATGALFGGFRRHDQRGQQAAQQEAYRQQQAQMQAQPANAAGRDTYNRAMKACLEGRGYTIS